MPASGPDRRDLAVARVALGVAAIGVAWLAWRNPATRQAVKRGAKFVLVTWLPAYVASQVREAWADAAPDLDSRPPGPGEAGQAPAGSPGPAVAAFAPPAPSE